MPLNRQIPAVVNRALSPFPGKLTHLIVGGRKLDEQPPGLRLRALSLLGLFDEPAKRKAEWEREIEAPAVGK
jgi:hypothetical protein